MEILDLLSGEFEVELVTHDASLSPSVGSRHRAISFISSSEDVKLHLRQHLGIGHRRHAFRRVKPMNSEIKGFPGEMAILLVYPPFHWDIPCN